MTAPHTEVAILCARAALLFNSQRDTHMQILCTGAAFLFTTHTNTADSVHMGLFFRLLVCATHRQVQILFTRTTLLFTSLCDCMRCERACAAFADDRRA